MTFALLKGILSFIYTVFQPEVHKNKNLCQHEILFGNLKEICTLGAHYGKCEAIFAKSNDCLTLKLVLHIYWEHIH